MHDVNEKFVQNVAGKDTKEDIIWGYLVVDGRLMLVLVLEKCDVGVWTGFMWNTIRSDDGLVWLNDVHLCVIKCGQFYKSSSAAVCFLRYSLYLGMIPVYVSTYGIKSEFNKDASYTNKIKQQHVE
jgi:hypothetical protein